MTRLAIFLLMIAGAPLSAQSIHGTAVYRMVEESAIRDIKEKLSDLVGPLSGWAQSLHHQYALDFSPQRAYYHPYRALKTEPVKQRRMRIMIMSSNAQRQIYTDRTAGRWVMILETSDETVYVEDSLLDFRWRILPQKRKIGDFIAFKAEGVVTRVKCPPRDSGLCNLDTARITAWFTPQIPVAFGPAIYGGLPGLILELQDGRNHYYLEKVTLENKASDVPAPPDHTAKAVRWMEWLRSRRDQQNDDPRRRRAASQH